MSNDVTRESIILAAGPIFADRGFERATVREICAAAGVNVAAINYYFGDKRRLYVETVTTARSRRATEVPLPTWDDTVPAEEKLRGHTTTLMRRMMGLDDAPWETRLLTREVLQPTEACRTLVEEHFRPQFDELSTVIGELLPDGVGPAVKHQFAFSLIGQCFFYRAASDVVSLLISKEEIGTEFGVEALADHITTTMLGALAAYARPGVGTGGELAGR
ncbi:MAG: CerR family C-terminal domain-containing protein [Planctomycetota bacterium]